MALIEALKSSDLVKEYQALEAHINQKRDFKVMFSKLKRLQQQIINIEAINKSEALKVAQAEYDEQFDKIVAHPTLNRYFHLQEEINHLIQEIKSIVEAEINFELTNTEPKK